MTPAIFKNRDVLDLDAMEALEREALTLELRVGLRQNCREDWREDTHAIETREPLTVPEWARKYRKIGQGGSPLSMHGAIEFDLDVMPWCREPMVAALDPTVSHLVLWFASGMGKTDGIVTNIIGYCITESPRNIMALYPTESARDKWSRDVLQRTIAATPVLADAVTEKKGGEAGNTIAYKSFPGGSLYATFAGSASNLRGPRVGLAYAGEVDAMPVDVGGSVDKPGEGDPLRLLFKRCEGFEEAIKIVEGTGTIKGKSRIESWYNSSDQRKWFVPCRKCGAEQVLFFRHLKWPRGKTHKAEIECEECGAMHNDAQRLRMVREGKWKATAGRSLVRGYWINAFNTTLPAERGYANKMHQIAEEWVSAKHSDRPRQNQRVVINTVFAECDDEDTDDMPRMAWEPLYARREAYATDATKLPMLPAGVGVITVGIDVQGDRIEVLFLGWSRTEEVWILKLHVLHGDPADDRIWDKLEPVLGWRFQHPSGARLEPELCFIDRGRWTQWVDKFCARESLRGKVYSVKGASEMGLPIVGRIRKTGRGGTYFRLGTDAAKEWIFGKLAILWPHDGKDFPPGFIHFPQTLDAEFFKQLTAERAFSEWFKGQQFRKFYPVDEQGNKAKKGTKVRNEGLDIFVYGLAAFRLRAWNWDEIEKNLEVKPGKDLAEEERKERQRKAAAEEEENSGFVTGWKRGR